MMPPPASPQPQCPCRGTSAWRQGSTPRRTSKIRWSMWMRRLGALGTLL